MSSNNHSDDNNYWDNDLKLSIFIVPNLTSTGCLFVPSQTEKPFVWLCLLSEIRLGGRQKKSPRNYPSSCRGRCWWRHNFHGQKVCRCQSAFTEKKGGNQSRGAANSWKTKSEFRNHLSNPPRNHLSNHLSGFLTWKSAPASPSASQAATSPVPPRQQQDVCVWGMLKNLWNA